MKKVSAEIAVDVLSDEKILDSWEKNAAPWVKAIQEQQIESRKFVTDQAIVEMVSSVSGKKVLDIGCGEGWLARALSELGYSVTGIDAVEELVNKAKVLGKGSFKALKYENISAETLDDKYDIAVCNFSLLGKESVQHLFNVIPLILNSGGCFIIQTLHPHISSGDFQYIDGWREGSWQGFSSEFSDPAPWYFRTVESWFKLFHQSGFTLNQVKEPLNSKSGKVSSLIMVGNTAK